MTQVPRAGAEAAVRELAPDPETLAARLEEVDYLAEEGLATAIDDEQPSPNASLTTTAAPRKSTVARTAAACPPTATTS